MIRQDIRFSAGPGYTTGSGPRWLCLAHLNNDNEPDLVVVNEDSDDISVLFGSDGLTFESPVRYNVGDYPRSVATADIDADGDNDLVVSNVGSDNLSVLRNNGDGSFEDAVNALCDGVTGSASLADLDGDGDIDIAVACHTTEYTAPRYGTVRIFFNEGDGTFVEGSAFPVAGEASINTVYPADFDGDGDYDLVTAHEKLFESIGVLFNNGDGSFGTATDYGRLGYAAYSIASDIDLDGDQDIITAISSGFDLSVMLNNGDGSFAAEEGYLAQYGSHFLAVANLDDDNNLDVAVASFGSGLVTVLKSAGDGTFGDFLELEMYNSVEIVEFWRDNPEERPIAIVAADFDGDGDMDLAAANHNTNTVTILSNNRFQ